MKQNIKNVFFIVIFTSLTFVTQAEETLKSKDVKKSLCSDLEVRAYDEFEMNFDEASCLWSGDFTIVEKTYNPNIRNYSNLLLKFTVKQSNIIFSGKAEAFRIIRFNSKGEMVLTWNTRNLKLKIKDKRAWQTIFNQILDDSGIDIHNGDAGISKVGSHFGLAEIKADLLKSLPGYGNPETDSEYDFCSYSTEEGLDSVLYNLKYHGGGFKDFLIFLKKQGQIKEAVYRGHDDGASEYCSHYFYRILTNDNHLIYVDIDLTT